MKRSKLFIYLFIAGDIGVITVTVFLLIHRLAAPRRLPVTMRPPERTAPSKPLMPNLATTLLPPTTAAAVAATPAGNVGSRRILFSYHNARARSVRIQADFTDWKKVPMIRDNHFFWQYQAVLSPGNYAYAFLVEDAAGHVKAIPDPANRRAKKIGTTMVSQIIVRPLASMAVHAHP